MRVRWRAPAWQRTLASYADRIGVAVSEIA